MNRPNKPPFRQPWDWMRRIHYRLLTHEQAHRDRECGICTPSEIGVICSDCVAVLRLFNRKDRRKLMDKLDKRRIRLIEKCFEEPMSPLKEKRRNLKMTQQQLADFLGVDQGMVSKVERGQKSMPDWWVNTLENMTKNRHPVG